MRAVVGYESMYGNTRQVAEAVAEGLRTAGPVAVVPVNQVTDEALDAADLLVVGAPTHAHGLPRASSREEAEKRADDASSTLHLEPTADDLGVREWTTDIRLHGTRVAAFDTRADLPALVSGRASKHVMRRLLKAGGDELAPAESFLVDKHQELESGELDRARAWGVALAALMTPSTARQ